MSLFDADDAVATLTVGQLTRQIGETIKRQFRAEVWVEGQIRNLSRSARGHVYFDLIEPVPAGAAPKASIPVTLFDSNRQIVNRIITRTGNSVRIDDGVEVRIRGAIEMYAPRGQVQLNMSSIDPEFTLGRLGADREQLLRELRSAGLLDANRQVPIPLVPLRIALITSDGSAAHADFTRQLETSGYRFEVRTISARVQGEFAPEEIAAALDRAAGTDCDVIALVRGGGARTDLAAFDTEPIARAIVACPLPVICGIGHEIDESIADLVAHASFKTPTACAQHLIERVVAFDFMLAERAEQLITRARVIPVLHAGRIDHMVNHVAASVGQRLQRAELRNGEAASLLERRVSRRIAGSHHQLGQASAQLRLAATLQLATAQRSCDDAIDRLVERPARRLDQATQRLTLIEAQIGAADPLRAMRRGWSITTKVDGSVVRSAADVSAGDDIITRLADGTVASTVTSTRSATPPPTTSQSASDTTPPPTISQPTSAARIQEQP